ncbi:AAA family ATPase [Clostridium sp. BL-8]|uniref:McrB family protein n=1 Tax=Clostridium sp. BL-8 TaxID=349938 RepID=UPI00098C0889|nr:AAA family ATPase [Clostridium sp. BL-8]OOM78810.1 hypothetical protein CLOBL_20580 [Clostridium sp. BL-8]
MINIKELKEIFDIEDLEGRRISVENNAIPIIEQIASSFLNMIQNPILNRCTIKSGFDVSVKKAWAVLQQSSIQDENTVINYLNIEFNFSEDSLNINMNSEFYRFAEGLAKNKGEFSQDSKKNFDEMLNQLKEQQNINICGFINDERIMLNIETFKAYLEEYYPREKKRKPVLIFGNQSAIDDSMAEQEILKVIQNVWNDLSPIRNYIISDQEKRDKVINLISLLKDHTGKTKIKSLFGYEYDVDFQIPKRKKGISEESFEQDVFLYSNNQKIYRCTIKYVLYFAKEPHGMIQLKYGNKDVLNNHITELLSEDVCRYYIYGNFRDSRQNIELALESNNFNKDEKAYYIGTYSNIKQNFTESIEEIKINMVKAALLIADGKGIIKLLKKPSLDSTIVENIENDNEDEMVSDYSDLSMKFKDIYWAIEQSPYVFEKSIIRDFHLNLTCLTNKEKNTAKHFVILNGISGTGKTKICSLYANAVYGIDLESKDNKYLQIIPVKPDWTDSTDLFGYYNNRDKKYIKTDFLDMILRAEKEREKPHFVVLDEMNLARVEYYLSDYLSAVESGKEVTLHNEEQLKDGIPRKISIPLNFYLIGTVNTDETTYSISDKVLDRAFVMTFTEVDFKTYWAKEENENLKQQLSEEFLWIQGIHEILKEKGLHFGYRSLGEMLYKMYGNLQLGEDGMSRTEAFDSVITEKVLPKVRGDAGIESTLVELGEYLKNNCGFKENSKTLVHLARMRQELETYGTTQFWH